MPLWNAFPKHADPSTVLVADATRSNSPTQNTPLGFQVDMNYNTGRDNTQLQFIPQKETAEECKGNILQDMQNSGYNGIANGSFIQPVSDYKHNICSFKNPEINFSNSNAEQIPHNIFCKSEKKHKHRSRGSEECNVTFKEHKRKEISPRRRRPSHNEGQDSSQVAPQMPDFATTAGPEIFFVVPNSKSPVELSNDILDNRQKHLSRDKLRHRKKRIPHPSLESNCNENVIDSRYLKHNRGDYKKNSKVTTDTEIPGCLREENCDTYRSPVTDQNIIAKKHRHGSRKQKPCIQTRSVAVGDDQNKNVFESLKKDADCQVSRSFLKGGKTHKHKSKSFLMPKLHKRGFDKDSIETVYAVGDILSKKKHRRKYNEKTSAKISNTNHASVEINSSIVCNAGSFETLENSNQVPLSSKHSPNGGENMMCQYYQKTPIEVNYNTVTCNVEQKPTNNIQNAEKPVDEIQQKNVRNPLDYFKTKFGRRGGNRVETETLENPSATAPRLSTLHNIDQRAKSSRTRSASPRKEEIPTLSEKKSQNCLLVNPGDINVQNNTKKHRRQKGDLVNVGGVTSLEPNRYFDLEQRKRYKHKKSKKKSQTSNTNILNAEETMQQEEVTCIESTSRDMRKSKKHRLKLCELSGATEYNKVKNTEHLRNSIQMPNESCAYTDNSIVVQKLTFWKNSLPIGSADEHKNLEESARHKLHITKDVNKLPANDFNEGVKTIIQKPQLTCSKIFDCKFNESENSKVRTEVSFSHLNKQPVETLYKSSEEEFPDTYPSVLPQSLVPKIDISKQSEVKAKHKKGEKNNAFSDAITKNEKIQQTNRSARNFFYYGGIMERCYKSTCRNDSNTLGFTVEGVEPPKMIRTTNNCLPTNSTSTTNSCVPTKVLQKTVLSGIEIKSTWIETNQLAENMQYNWNYDTTIIANEKGPNLEKNKSQNELEEHKDRVPATSSMSNILKEVSGVISLHSLCPSKVSSVNASASFTTEDEKLIGNCANKIKGLSESHKPSKPKGTMHINSKLSTALVNQSKNNKEEHSKSQKVKPDESLDVITICPVKTKSKEVTEYLHTTVLELKESDDTDVCSQGTKSNEQIKIANPKSHTNTLEICEQRKYKKSCDCSSNIAKSQKRIEKRSIYIKREVSPVKQNLGYAKKKAVKDHLQNVSKKVSPVTSTTAKLQVSHFSYSNKAHALHGKQYSSTENRKGRYGSSPSSVSGRSTGSTSSKELLNSSEVSIPSGSRKSRLDYYTMNTSDSTVKDNRISRSPSLKETPLPKISEEISPQSSSENRNIEMIFNDLRESQQGMVSITTDITENAQELIAKKVLEEVQKVYQSLLDDPVLTAKFFKADFSILNDEGSNKVNNDFKYSETKAKQVNESQEKKKHHVSTSEVNKYDVKKETMVCPFLYKYDVSPLKKPDAKFVKNATPKLKVEEESRFSFCKNAKQYKKTTQEKCHVAIDPTLENTNVILNKSVLIETANTKFETSLTECSVNNLNAVEKNISTAKCSHTDYTMSKIKMNSIQSVENQSLMSKSESVLEILDEDFENNHCFLNSMMGLVFSTAVQNIMQGIDPNVTNVSSKLHLMQKWFSKEEKEKSHRHKAAKRTNSVSSTQLQQRPTNLKDFKFNDANYANALKTSNVCPFLEKLNCKRQDSRSSGFITPTSEYMEENSLQRVSTINKWKQKPASNEKPIIDTSKEPVPVFNTAKKATDNKNLQATTHFLPKKIEPPAAIDRKKVLKPQTKSASCKQLVFSKPERIPVSRAINSAPSSYTNVINKSIGSEKCDIDPNTMIKRPTSVGRRFYTKQDNDKDVPSTFLIRKLYGENLRKNRDISCNKDATNKPKTNQINVPVSIISKTPKECTTTCTATKPLNKKNVQTKQTKKDDLKTNKEQMDTHKPDCKTITCFVKRSVGTKECDAAVKTPIRSKSKAGGVPNTSIETIKHNQNHANATERLNLLQNEKQLFYKSLSEKEACSSTMPNTFQTYNVLADNITDVYSNRSNIKGSSASISRGSSSFDNLPPIPSSSNIHHSKSSILENGSFTNRMYTSTGFLHCKKYFGLYRKSAKSCVNIVENLQEPFKNLYSSTASIITKIPIEGSSFDFKTSYEFNNPNYIQSDPIPYQNRMKRMSHHQSSLIECCQRLKRNAICDQIAAYSTDMSQNISDSKPAVPSKETATCNSMYCKLFEVESIEHNNDPTVAFKVRFVKIKNDSETYPEQSVHTTTKNNEIKKIDKCQKKGDSTHLETTNSVNPNSSWCAEEDMYTVFRLHESYTVPNKNYKLHHHTHSYEKYKLVTRNKELDCSEYVPLPAVCSKLNMYLKNNEDCQVSENGSTTPPTPVSESGYGSCKSRYSLKKVFENDILEDITSKSNEFDGSGFTDAHFSVINAFPVRENAKKYSNPDSVDSDSSNHLKPSTWSASTSDCYSDFPGSSFTEERYTENNQVVGSNDNDATSNTLKTHKKPLKEKKTSASNHKLEDIAKESMECSNSFKCLKKHFTRKTSSKELIHKTDSKFKGLIQSISRQFHMNKKLGTDSNLSYTVVNPVICTQCKFSKKGEADDGIGVCKTKAVHNMKSKSQKQQPSEKTKLGKQPTAKPKQQSEKVQVSSNVKEVPLYVIVDKKTPDDKSKGSTKQRGKCCLKPSLDEEQPSTSGIIQKLCRKVCFSKTVINKPVSKEELPIKNKKIECSTETCGPEVCRKTQSLKKRAVPQVVEQSVQAIYQEPEKPATVPTTSTSTGTSSSSAYSDTVDNFEKFKKHYISSEEVLQNTSIEPSQNLPATSIRKQIETGVTSHLSSDYELGPLIDATVEKTLKEAPKHLMKKFSSKSSLENYITKLLEASVKRLLSDLSISNNQKIHLGKSSHAPSSNTSSQSSKVSLNEDIIEKQSSHVSLDVLINELEDDDFGQAETGRFGKVDSLTNTKKKGKKKERLSTNEETIYEKVLKKSSSNIPGPIHLSKKGLEPKKGKIPDETVPLKSKPRLKELRDSLTDKEVFDRLLESYEKEDEMAERLSTDEEFFATQLKMLKNKDSTESIIKMEDLEKRQSSVLSEATNKKSITKSSMLAVKQKFSLAKDKNTSENRVSREVENDDDDENKNVKFIKGKQINQEERKLLESISIEDTKTETEDNLSNDTKTSCDSSTVKPEDLGKCFLRGFRADYKSLSGHACLRATAKEKDAWKKHQIASGQVIDFSERESPLEYLLALGFSIDEASNAIKDEDVKNRLFAAITEARVWINQIDTMQGTLLYLVAYKAKPRTMRYFLQLVEAIINRRINNAVKLDAFLKVLEKVEDGDLTMVHILGTDKFDDEENEEKIVKKQLRDLFLKVYRTAEQESNRRNKPLTKEAILLLRILAAKYRAGLHPHLELIARYIGQELLVTDVQLEAAMIYLSRLDTANVNLEEFEQYCGIKCEKKKARSKTKKEEQKSAKKSKP